MRRISIAFLFTLILVLVPPSVILLNHASTEAATITGISDMQLHAQTQKPDAPVQSEKARPADASADLYKVLCIILVVWIGLALFLFRLDRKISGLEKELNKLP